MFTPPTQPATAFTWPVLLGTAVSALPTIVAWRAGRLHPRDPVGQVAIAWGVVSLSGLAQYAVYAADRRLAVALLIPISAMFNNTVLPLLLTPPLLTWIGPRAKRFQPLVLAAILLGSLAVLFTLGIGREARLLLRNISMTALAALSTWAMTAQARRAAAAFDPVFEPGGAWIGAGQLLYFLATLVGRSLGEALVARSWGALIQVTQALHLIYGVSMVAISWGIWLGRRQTAPPRPATPAPAGGTA